LGLVRLDLFLHHRFGSDPVGCEFLSLHLETIVRLVSDPKRRLERQQSIPVLLLGYHTLGGWFVLTIIQGHLVSFRGQEQTSGVTNATRTTRGQHQLVTLTDTKHCPEESGSKHNSVRDYKHNADNNRKIKIGSECRF
jgi:hypothetical protein